MRTFDRGRGRTPGRQAAKGDGPSPSALHGHTGAVRALLRPLAGGAHAPGPALALGAAHTAAPSAVHIVDADHPLERDARAAAARLAAPGVPADAAPARSPIVGQAPTVEQAPTALQPPTAAQGRAGVGPSALQVPGDVLALARASNGSALPAHLRDAFAPSLGPAVAAARVHVDAAAAEAATRVGARAFTLGEHVYFGARHRSGAARADGAVLAHELAHVAQRPPAGALLRDDDPDAVDPEVALGPMLGPQWAALYGRVGSLIADLAVFQQASSSPTRSAWLNVAGRFMTELAGVRDGAALQDVSRRFDTWADGVYDAGTAAGTDYFTVLDRYEREVARLVDAPSAANIEALRYLSEIYQDTRGRIARGDLSLLTPDDFVTLRAVLADDSHLWYGELKVARQRNDDLTEMLRVVESLRRAGRDDEKLVPEWDARVGEELDRLALLARASVKQTQRVEFERLRKDLAARRNTTLDAHPAKKSTLEKGYLLVKGALSAVVGPFVEAGKQVVDLGQIALHFATFTHYRPRFISDVADAAEHGATTSELLKGMVKGLIETPERLWKAIEKDDWEAIGRETANLYMMAKMGKEAAAKAAPWIKLVRARAVGLRGGMSADAALAVRAVARRAKLVIRFRPVDPAVVKLRAQGAVAKPEFLKMKSIKDIDVYLGAKKADIGKVGYFEPTRPANLAKLPADLQARIEARFAARMEEFRVHAADVARMEAKGLVTREGQVLLDGASGKPFTGDYDLFDIRAGSARGPAVEYEALPKSVRDALSAKPVEAQHGAHLDWKEIPSDQVQNYVDIVLSARPKPGAQPLIEFHPDGRIRYTYFTD